MHHTDPPRWQHSHDYTIDTSAAERRTRIVIAITATMMVVEIAAGVMFGSMALLADGWHMSTHVAAGKFAAIVCIAGYNPRPAAACREMLLEHEELVHVTVEVRRCA